MSFAIRMLTRSLNVFHLAGSACNNCDIEILDALTPKYDLERFGITLVGSIRHADLILLSGVFNKKSAIRVARLLSISPGSARSARPVIPGAWLQAPANTRLISLDPAAGCRVRPGRDHVCRRRAAWLECIRPTPGRSVPSSASEAGR